MEKKKHARSVWKGRGAENLECTSLFKLRGRGLFWQKKLGKATNWIQPSAVFDKEDRDVEDVQTGRERCFDVGRATS